MPVPFLHRTLLLLVLAPLLSGCLYSREITQTRRALERDMPGVEFDRRVVLSLGPVSMRLASWITRRADRSDSDVQTASGLIRDVRRVKVGVYETRFLDDPEQVALPSGLRQVLEREGWEMAVRVRDEREHVWIYYRERRGTVRDLYVVVFDEEDLVIARLQGNLNRILDRALAEYGDEEDWTASAYR